MERAGKISGRGEGRRKKERSGKERGKRKKGHSKHQHEEKQKEEEQKPPAITEKQLRKHIGHYTLGQKLGTGAYGVVYKAIHQGRGTTVAVKQLYLQSLSSDVSQKLQMEIHLLRGLQHKNIVSYIDHLIVESTLNIVMEYVENGSLYGMVRDYGCFPEELCKVYISKTLEGLVYLHAQGVIHRDIKGANILITKDGEVKLADFGVSQSMGLMDGDEDATTPMGTPFYMAPEVIQFMGAQPQSDVWSLGCTIIELLRGDPPYFDMTPFSAIYKIVNEGIEIPSGLSSSLYDFLSKCFQRDPALRVTAKKLLPHPWLRKKENTEETTFEDVQRKIENHQQMLEMVKNEVEYGITVEAQLDVNKLLNEKDEKEGKEKRKEQESKKKRDTSGPKSIEELEKIDKQTPAVEDFGADFDLDGFDDAEIGELDLGGLSFPSSGSSIPAVSQPSAGSGQIDSYDDLLGGIDLDGFDAPSQTQPAAVDDMGFDLDFDDIDLEARLELNVEQQSELDWDDDIFSTMDEDESEEAQKQQHIREAIKEEIEDLVKTLNSIARKPSDDPAEDISDVERACSGLLEYFRQKHSAVTSLKKEILLATIQILEYEIAVVSLLHLIVHFIRDETHGESNLIAFALFGGISKLVDYGRTSQPTNIRTAAAFIIQEICSVPVTLQMFVSSRNLNTIVRFLDAEDHPIEINRIGINCLVSFFELSPKLGGANKHHFYQLLLDENLLPTLAGTLKRFLKERNVNYMEKIINLLCDFAQGTPHVKQLVSTSPVMGVMLEVFKTVDNEKTLINSILRTVRFLAVYDEAILHILEKWIGPSIQYSMKCIEEGTIQDVHTHVTHALYHLCFLNPRRQALAAKNGSIGFLRYVAKNNSLKEFAIPMLGDLSRCRAESARNILWAQGGLQIYLDLLGDKGWFSDGLQAIADWSSAKDFTDLLKMEAVLNLPENIAKIIEASKRACLPYIPSQVFVGVLDSILKITASSILVAKSLSEEHSEFVKLIASSLNNRNLYVREKLLRVLINLFEKHDDPWGFISQPFLWEPVNKMAASDSAVVVCNLAKFLIGNAEKKRK